MIPILYSSTKGAPVTTGMGMGPLADCIECTCYEQVNGEFECTFKYPYTGSLYPYIRKGAIVAAKPSPAYGNVYQQFKIYKISKPINGIITVNAHHVSYELSGLPVGPFAFEDATPHVIMNELYDASLISDERFVFHSDLTKKINISSSVPKNLREVMLGTENSIASTSKNEFLFNNYSVSLLEARGQATEVEIIYGRELVDYNQEESIENAYSHFVAYAITKNTNGEDMIVGTSPGAIQLIDPVSLGHQKCLIRDFTGDFENSDDITQSNLAVKAAEYIEKNNLSIPSINFRLSFVDLKKNSEYSDIVTAFGNIGLGDNIKVLIQKLGITAKARIIATTYDVLAEEFISVEVGSRRENVADTIYKLQKNNKMVARSVSSLQGNNKYSPEHNHDDRYPTKTDVFVAIAGSVSELSSGINDLLSGKSDTNHTHDDRYCTETEVNTKLSGKSDTNHTHDDIYPTKSQVTTAIVSTTSELSSGIYELLEEKSDKAHIHDGRYYTETEVDSLLDEKSDTSHNHDDVYPTRSQVMTAIVSTTSELSSGISELLKEKSDIGHTHEDIYYTETEVNSLLDGKSDTSHNHNSVYYTETEVNNLLSGKSDTSHTHDGRYCTETEVNKLLSGKSDASHNHDDRYPTKSQVTTAIVSSVSELSTGINDLLSDKSNTDHTHTALFYGNYNLYLVAGTTCTIRPNNADTYSYYFGSGDHRFNTIYAKNALNTGSDRNLKENIESIPQRYVNMLDGIEPVIYKWKNGDRIHTGYISQEVEESMKNNEITAEEFGGLCKDAKLDEEGNPVDGEYIYSLRYGEFIPILHAKIKQLEEKYNAKIAECERKIAELNEKISTLLSHHQQQ